MLARGRAKVPVVFQFLISPTLAEHNQTTSSYEITDPRLIWTREINLIGWRSYLGREPGGTDVLAYTAPARAENLATARAGATP
ncbi:hypothetical protein HRbin26_02276 [bacterium HR26]|nr:hypothetical protein HRbin26_02276 [bacterium HR26]